MPTFEFDDIILSNIEPRVMVNAQFRKDYDVFKERLDTVIKRCNYGNSNKQVDNYDYRLKIFKHRNGMCIHVDDIYDEPFLCVEEDDFNRSYKVKLPHRNCFSIRFYPINSNDQEDDFNINVHFSYGPYQIETEREICNETRKYGFADGKFVSELKIMVENSSPFEENERVNIPLGLYREENQFTIINRVCISGNMTLEYIIYDNNFYVLVRRVTDIDKPTFDYYQFKSSFDKVKRHSFDYYDKMFFGLIQNQIDGIQEMSEGETMLLKTMVKKMTTTSY